AGRHLTLFACSRRFFVHRPPVRVEALAIYGMAQPLLPFRPRRSTMRIGTRSAIALCLVSFVATRAAPDQHGRPTTPHAPAPPRTVHTTGGQHETHAPRAPHGHRTTPTTTTTTTGTTTNRIAARISAHPQQAARIQRLLPAGMTLETASAGFRNQGQ